MSEMIIKNGCVVDPLNNIDCEVKDICVKDGKIVESVGNGATVIDAKGKLVYPGGFDMHTHIAGSKLNAGRMMRPEDSRKNIVARTDITRPQTGYTVPNTYAIGYNYAKLGYTTAFEAAIPILKARHTHEEFEDIPIIDKSGLTLFGNNWEVMDCIREGDMDKLTAYVAWGLKASRGYGVKIVNPGGVEEWGFGKNVHGIDDIVSNFDVTPAQIITSLSEVNERLNLPHAIHLHPNNLGHPGNYETTLATWDLLKGKTSKRDRPVLHSTHVMFHSFGGSNWGNVESKIDVIADYVNKNNHLSVDMGQLIFGSATTMTGDGPVQYANARMFKAKWSNGDVELEGGSGVVPLFYVAKVSAHAIMWAMGQELALRVEDPWRIALTTDHPNGGPFVNYPEVMALLMSSKKREDALTNVHKLASERTTLPELDRELTFSEIAIMTRAGTARLMGLQETKGHLGVGADADIAIYNIDPANIDQSVEHETIKKAFQKAAYTIKGGVVVVKDGEITATPMGTTIWVNATESIPAEAEAAMQKDMDKKFRNYYSLSKANYMVQDEYLSHSLEIKAGGN